MVAGNLGVRISLLVNLDRKVNGLQIIRQQFEQVIGVAVTRGDIIHKLSGIHYVWATAVTTAVTRAHHSKKDG